MKNLAVDGNQGDTGAADFKGGPIAGRVDLTEEDFRAVWAVLPRNRRALVELVFTFLAIPLFWLTTAVLDSHGLRGVMSLPVVVGAFVVSAVLAFTIWLRRSLWTRSAVRQLRGVEGAEFRFDSLGISMVTQGHQDQHTWSTLFRCTETARVFAIFTAPNMVMVVPKRAFDANEQTRLRAWLQTHVPKRELAGAKVWRPLVQKTLLWFLCLCVFAAVWRAWNSR